MINDYNFLIRNWFYYLKVEMVLLIGFEMGSRWLSYCISLSLTWKSITGHKYQQLCSLPSGQAKMIDKVVTGKSSTEWYQCVITVVCCFVNDGWLGRTIKLLSSEQINEYSQCRGSSCYYNLIQGSVSFLPPLDWLDIYYQILAIALSILPASDKVKLII